MNKQTSLNLDVDSKIDSIEDYKFEPIKGFPMLNWKGKRPFNSTQFYPAQLKENYGEEVNGWMNKIFWGDNLQVMSHLLKEYRGKIDLIYIDPPYDSKADYKKKINLKGKKISNDNNSFEEKQYTDIWSNDDYLQYMYERLIILKELLSDTGSIYLHCDYRKVHHLRCIMDEVFGASENNFQNEIIWCYRGMAVSKTHYLRRHDNLLFYSKNSKFTFNWHEITEPLEESTKKKYKYKDKSGRLFRLHGRNLSGSPIQNNTDIELKWLDSNPELCRVDYLDDKLGTKPRDWFIMDYINVMADERENYPTQKPEALLQRIIKASTNPDDIVFDCFMGSGTTQAVAMKLGRRFIGADINLGAIETTTKRLNKIAKDIKSETPEIEYKDENEDAKTIENFYTGFSVYNVNNYDIFRNPVQAKELIIEALEIQPLPNNSIYDGEKDGRMVKIMDINRIATRADLNSLITNFNYKAFEKTQEESPNKPVEHLLLICMGHEPDLAANLQNEVPYKLDIEVVDILRDKSNLEFKRDSDAKIIIKNNKLIIEQFYPMNLLQKLSLQKENIEDWKELVESIKIDFNYDSSIFEPTLLDIPDKKEMVIGEYEIPEDAGDIKIKITDLLSESLEKEVYNG